MSEMKIGLVVLTLLCGVIYAEAGAMGMTDMVAQLVQVGTELLHRLL